MELKDIAEAEKELIQVIKNVSKSFKVTLYKNNDPLPLFSNNKKESFETDPDQIPEENKKEYIDELYKKVSQVLKKYDMKLTKSGFGVSNYYGTKNTRYIAVLPDGLKWPDRRQGSKSKTQVEVFLSMNLDEHGQNHFTFYKPKTREIMELKDIVIAAGNEDVNAFQKDFTELLMVKVNSQINNIKQDIISAHGAKQQDVQ